MLHEFCEQGNLEKTLEILAKKKQIDINSKGKFGRTPIHLACMKGHLNVILPLINSGASIEQKNDHGFSALYIASLFGHDLIVRTLIESNADIHSTDLGGLTPLHCKNFIRIWS
jgi:ankyrin repeat protein